MGPAGLLVLDWYAMKTDTALPWVLRPTGSAARPPRFHIGVDGGGTGTRLELCDAQGHLLGRGESGPSALGQGVAQAWTHISLALQQAAAQAGLAGVAPADCAMGLGLSGVGNEQLSQAFIAAQPGLALMVLDSDGFTGVLGAHAGQPGAVLVSGTGSVGEALRRDGSRVCVGGWGWANGDEGSGAWLGRCAMRHAQRVFDGREPDGALAQALLDQAGRSREALLAWCAAAGQAGYAALAPLVFELAARDPWAEALLNEAAAELTILVKALDPAGDLPLALAGSVARRLAPRFGAAVQARLVEPRGDAVAGALLLLRQQAQA